MKILYYDPQDVIIRIIRDSNSYPLSNPEISFFRLLQKLLGKDWLTRKMSLDGFSGTGEKVYLRQRRVPYLTIHNPGISLIADYNSFKPITLPLENVVF